MHEGAAKGVARVRARRVPAMRMRLSPACPHCVSPWIGDFQAQEDRASHVCVIKGESLKKEVLTPRAAWKEDEKARREEDEADKTNPLRNHVLGDGFRSVVAKLLFELLQRERGGGTDESGGTASKIVSRQSGHTLSGHSDFPCQTKAS